MQILNLSLSRKALILVAVPVLFEVLIAGVTLHLVSKTEQARQAEAHARELALHLNTILSLHMQRVSYAFLSQHTSEQMFAQRVKDVQVEREGEAQAIDSLVTGHEEEAAKWTRMRFLFAKVETGLDDVVNSYKGGARALAAVKFAALQKEIDEIFQLGKELARREVIAKEEQHVALERYNNDLRTAVQLSVLGSIVLAFALAAYFNQGTSSRLKTLMHNTDRLSAGLPPDRTITGVDELAAIDKTYHKLHDSLVSLRKKERAILDHAANAICSIDKELRFSDANRAAQKLWGFDGQDFIGSRIANVIATVEQETVCEHLRQCLARDAETTFDAHIKKADGTMAETVWVASGSQTQGSIFCVIQDVTEQRQIERLKSDFVAMVSHDLRTPLTAIQMSLSMLETQEQSSLSDHALATITRAQVSVTRLMALVNSLLDLERLESGQIDVLPCAETMRDLVAAAIDATSSIARQGKIDVNNLVASEVEVFADRERIEQVLINLIGNALKFSPAQSTVSISASCEQDSVLIRITDQGRGVPKEREQEIFERFKQVERDDSREGRGSGLGLAICKAIVERHGGRIGVESNPSGGSIFWFTLPVSGDLPV